MANRKWRLIAMAVLAGLLTWLSAPTRAEDTLSVDRGDGTTFGEWARQDWRALEPQAGRSRLAESNWLPRTDPPTFGGESFGGSGPAPRPVTGPTGREGAPPFAGDFPSPKAQSRNAGWTRDSRSDPNRAEPNGGTVCGRLSHRGRPLVNCHVVIVPMHQEREAYCFDPDRKPLDAVTDDEGVYRLENVPAGEYKLTWLPAGQTRWIRRIAMRPDVTVRSTEATNLKEIRVALQTIN